MKSILLITLSSLLLFSSCREMFAKQVRGNGNITTQNRQAGTFNEISVSGNINVYLKQDSTPSIKVEADDNLQQYIETVQDGNRLRIQPREGYNLHSSAQVKVYVSAAMYKSFEASGACDIFSEGKITSPSGIDLGLSGSCDATMNLTTEKISVDVSGSCEVKLEGQTKDFTVQGSGNTNLKCFNLVADNVDLDISGAGDAEVHANNKLNGSISGAANVHYKGSPQTDIHTSGASSIVKSSD